MKIRPLHDRVLVKRIEEDMEKTKGGIIIPDTAKEKPQQGKVIAVGKGKVGEDGKVTPLDVKAGDTILFGKYSGSEIKIDGDEHLIMKDLVVYLAKQLVNHPDAVEVKETPSDTTTVLELRVAKEDIGRVIGKQGRTAKSIRTILNAVASRTNRKVVLEIIEEK